MPRRAHVLMDRRDGASGPPTAAIRLLSAAAEPGDVVHWVGREAGLYRLRSCLVATQARLDSPRTTAAGPWDRAACMAATIDGDRVHLVWHRRSGHRLVDALPAMRRWSGGGVDSWWAWSWSAAEGLMRLMGWGGLRRRPVRWVRIAGHPGPRAAQRLERWQRRGRLGAHSVVLSEHGDGADVGGVRIRRSALERAIAADAAAVAGAGLEEAAEPRSALRRAWCLADEPGDGVIGLFSDAPEATDCGPALLALGLAAHVLADRRGGDGLLRGHRLLVSPHAAGRRVWTRMFDRLGESWRLIEDPRVARPESVAAGCDLAIVPTWGSVAASAALASAEPGLPTVSDSGGGVRDLAAALVDGLDRLESRKRAESAGAV